MKKSARPRAAAIKASATKKTASPAVTVSDDPYIEAWKKEKSEAHRFPTVFELSQISAVLSLGKYWKNYWDESDGPQEDWSVAAAAYSLWEHCGRILDDKFGQAIYYAEMAAEYPYEPPDVPEWLWALQHEDFPLGFDKALELIIGKKIRKSDRYAQFRAFMRALIKDPTLEEDKRVTIAETRFIELKEKGFSAESFEKAGNLFDAWKATQAKEKARNAALKRWSKKKNEKAH